MRRRLTCVFAALVAFSPALAQAQDVLGLAIGDPARRDKKVGLALDAIVDTADGAVLSPAQVAQRLSDTDILFVGESHTSIDFHRAQAQIIQALLDAGREVMVGLEMFPVTEQAHLDRWIDEGLSEAEFLEASRWYEHWGYHWNYYREIFVLAQQRGARMYALNAPREIVSAVRRKGIANLDPEEAAYLPPSIDTDNPDHLRLFKSYFGDDDSMHSAMSDEQWQSMFAAQCTWDATMGYNAVVHRDANQTGDPIMVVLIGSGHVSYGLGIERQANRFFDGATASLIPVPVVDDEGRATRTVQGSYANFVWGIPGESSPLYPSLGLSTRVADEGEGLEILLSQPGTPAGDAGVQAGDRLIAIDRQPVSDKETYNRLVASKRWGDSIELQVLRGDAVKTYDVPLRRDQ